MLPPWAPGVIAAIASFRAGATATQPSIGLSGSSRCAGVMSVESRDTIPFTLSMFQIIRFASRSVRAAIAWGVTAYGANRLPE